MAVDEPQIVPESISSSAQVGYLRQVSTMVNCPACEHFELSIVQLEAVTKLQRFLQIIKLCKKWKGRTDINHYCAHCGCYIGRFVPVGCYESWISRKACQQAKVDDMTLKTKPKDCAVRAQKSRESVLAKRAAKRAKQLAEPQTQAAQPAVTRTQ